MKKKNIPNHPLAEVFGHLTTNQSDRAKRYRNKCLCPFNNKVPNCTKDKAKNPLGVCSVYHNNRPIITCPIRFREDWVITDDAADFFFSPSAKWTTLTEVRLNDANGKSAGNIDVVLVAYDNNGKVYDFGALEIQAVYISGNIRNPFEYFMKKPDDRGTMDWTHESNYPRPDYLSSSRKRLAPQLLFKGGVLNAWGKKMAVALNRDFFNTLPKLEPAPKNEAEIAWLLYDLVLKTDKENSQVWKLKKIDVVYTKFFSALEKITTPHPGDINNFVQQLQQRMDKQIEIAPTNQSIGNPFNR